MICIQYQRTDELRSVRQSVGVIAHENGVAIVTRDATKNPRGVASSMKVVNLKRGTTGRKAASIASNAASKTRADLRSVGGVLAAHLIGSFAKTIFPHLISTGRCCQGHHPRQEHQGSQGVQGPPTIQEGLRLSGRRPCPNKIGALSNPVENTIHSRWVLFYTEAHVGLDARIRPERNMCISELDLRTDRASL